MVRERLPQGLDRLDLRCRRERAALEFQRPEAVVGDHRLGLGDDAGRVDGRPEPVRFQAGVLRPLVEEVGRERYGRAYCASQQIDDRNAGGLALRVESGHLERRVRREDGAGRCRRAGESLGVAAAGATARVIGRRGGRAIAWSVDDRGHPAAEAVEVEDRQPDDLPAGGLEPGQHGVVAVRLAEPDHPVVADQLDDAAQGPRLVYAGDVEQWRIPERDRRDDDLTNDHATPPTWTFRAARPAAMIWTSRSMCGGVGSTSGGRTPPTGSPASRAPAFTSATA